MISKEKWGKILHTVTLSHSQRVTDVGNVFFVGTKLCLNAFPTHILRFSNERMVRFVSRQIRFAFSKKVLYLHRICSGKGEVRGKERKGQNGAIYGKLEGNTGLRGQVPRLGSRQSPSRRSAIGCFEREVCESVPERRLWPGGYSVSGGKGVFAELGRETVGPP